MRRFRKKAGVAAFAIVAVAAGAMPAVTSAAAPEHAGQVKPCGKGDASGATDLGVTDDTITIGTVQDVGGDLRPGLRLDNQKAMEAFVEWCNGKGGILGRELELVKYDSALLDAFPQYQRACDEVFAIVGEGVVFDDAGAEPIAECGIPTVPAFSTTAVRQESEFTYPPQPNPPGLLATGRYKYLKSKFDGVEERAAILCADTTTTQYSCDRVQFAAEEEGFDFVYRGTTEITVTNWGPFVDQLRQNDVTYVTMVADEQNWAGLQREIAAQGLDIMVQDSGAGIYSEDYLEQAGPAAEGTLISLGVVPFEEADDNAELRRYIKFVEQVDGEPTALGISGWSAGLLFATAVQSLGSDVTRAGLITAIQGIHDWDGNGLQAPADVGAKQPTGCFIQLQVKNGEFVRIFPKEGFECRPNAIVEVPEEFQS